ncbi:MAG: hypothetical protein IJG47_04930 [Microbacterium sp.]|nr:hypothetical protein [Microbacterium sp.]
MANPTRDPAITRDAKAWRDAAGVSYTQALRLIEDPLHQGILGGRIVVRDLLRVLEDDSLLGIGATSGAFGRNGLHAEVAMREELTGDVLHEILLAAEVLRMYTHSNTLAPGGTPPMTASGIRFDASLIDLYSREWVSSYDMKHTVEQMLGDVKPYVSNGAVIVAARMIGLPIVDFDESSPNVNIGVRRDEHERLRGALTDAGRPMINPDLPPGFARLRAVLERVKVGEPFNSELAIPLTAPRLDTTFHDWLVTQADRRGLPGRLAHSYAANVHFGAHGPAGSPDDLLSLVDRWYSGPEFDRIPEYLADQYRSHPNPAS